MTIAEPLFKAPVPVTKEHRVSMNVKKVPGRAVPAAPQDIETEWVWVTPGAADIYLKKMHKNRTKSRLDVSVMADNLREGNFFPGISPVFVDGDDTPWDGQHRFQAVIESGVPTYMMFVRGITSDMAEYIDTGRKRTYSDSLRINGTQDYKRRAVVAKLCAMHEKHGIEGIRNPSGMPLTRAEMDKWVGHPAMHGAVLIGEALNRAVKANPSYVSYAVLRTMKTDDTVPEADRDETSYTLDATGFWEKVKNGESLVRGDAALTLRNYLQLGGQGRIPTDRRLTELYAHTNSWNKHIQGKSYTKVNPKYQVNPRSNRKYFPAVNLMDFITFDGKSDYVDTGDDD